jgi:Bacterial Ig-like domain (group 2)
MKYFGMTLACAAVALFLACGAGHPDLKSIQVNPQQAQALSPRGEVGFTAMGIFSNNDSRELTAVDGAKWISSNNFVASIGSNTGQATCLAPGTVTITVTAPVNLNLTTNNGINNTSSKVSGTATLVCT